MMGKIQCPLCDDTGKILVRPTRLIGATYSFDDPWKGDEHFEPCPLCQNNPALLEEKTYKVDSKPWWAKNRFTHFLVVATDLLWRVTKKGADIKDLLTAARVSWDLTKPTKQDKGING